MAPTALGPYRVLRSLATGGMGELYLGQLDGPAGFSKILAIKRILPHLASDQRFVELFLEEARLAAALSHPNVVQIFELGQHEGTYYIAMEYVRGKSLRAVMRRLLQNHRAMPPALAARICSNVLQGLHHAHQMKNRRGEPRPIVHRDVSPENVLVSLDGAVKVVDFGIAKAVDPSVYQLTGLLHGKLSYMSPEQLLRRPVDPRTDVYGVAVLLFELLTGQPPFSGHSVEELRAKMNAGHPPLGAMQPVPAWLDAVVTRALAPEPADRYASAEEMALALEEHLRSMPEAPSPPQVARYLTELFGAELQELPLEANPVGTRMLEGPGEVVTQAGGFTRIGAQAEPPKNLAGTTVADGPLALGDTLGDGDGEEERPPEPQAALRALDRAGLEPATVADGAAPRRRRLPIPLPFAAALALTVGLGVLGWQLWPRSGSAPETTVPAPAAALPSPAAEPDAPRAIEPPGEPGVSPTPVAGTVAGEAAEAEARSPDEPSAREVEGSTAGSAARAANRGSPAPRVRRVRGFGTVDLRVHPWAEVLWNRRLLGTTPMTPIRLPAGKQVLTLRNRQLNVERKIEVDVAPYEQERVEVNLLNKRP